MKSNSNWLRVVPRGTFPHPNGRTQDIDATSTLAITLDFALADGPIHLTFDHLENRPIAGWIYELENRPDGVYGLVTFSAQGKQAVDGDRYKYLSPVLKCVEVDASKVRPFRLESVGLTNNPVMKDLVLCNSNAQQPDLDFQVELCTLLGLPSDATDDEIKQALKQFWGSRESRSIPRAIRNRAMMRNNGQWTPDQDWMQQGDLSVEQTKRLEHIANQLAKGKTAEQLRRLAKSHAPSSHMRDALWRRADAMENTRGKTTRKGSKK